MKIFSAGDLAALPHAVYVEALRAGFCGHVTTPPRFVSGTVPNTTFFAMPAWSTDFTGIKTITLKSDNAAKGLPTIQGTYQLFDNATGAAVALMDGTELTRLRTAAASALAADYLARKDASTLLLVGAGALAPHFAKAHAAMRPIRRILVFNRTPEKAEAVAQAIGGTAVRDVAAACAQADIVSCITSGLGVAVQGAWLRPGTHLDLVGAYKPDMREVDGAAVGMARVYVDTHEGAKHEAGDLHCAAKEGQFDWAQVQGDLHELCQGKVQGRRSESEITLFKSSGTALEDLAAAKMVYLRSLV
jgi:ornithine cyclodeaminase/alanine dehydrogenase-like protein (mu-crystallin family)